MPSAIPLFEANRRVPSVFFWSGFIFDINKVQPQDGTQHEKQIRKIMWIHLRTLLVHNIFSYIAATL